jgi:YNFM family putative membrane transporter
MTRERGEPAEDPTRETPPAGSQPFVETGERPAASGRADLFTRAGTPDFRRVTLALAAAGFSTYALLYCVQPLLPVFSAELGVSPGASSLSLSVTTGMLAVSMLVAGRVSDVHGRKPIMVVSLFAVGILTVLSAFSPNWVLLLVMRALTGITVAGVPAIAMAYLAEEIHPRDLGAAMGLYIAGNAYGGMAGRVLSGILIDATRSWRMTLAVIGLLGIAAAVLFVLLLPPSRRFKPDRGLSMGHLARAFAVHVRDPGLVELVLVPFLIMGGFVTTYNYLSYRLVLPPFDLSQGLSGAIFLVYLLGGPASAWFGRIAGRHGRARMMGAAMVLMLAGLLMTATSDLALSIVGIATLTCGFFGAHSIASGWVGRRAETARAQAASLYLFSYYAGSSLFGSLGGIFYERLGWPGIVGLVAVLILLALGLARRLGLREARERRAEAASAPRDAGSGRAPRPSP